MHKSWKVAKKSVTFQDQTVCELKSILIVAGKKTESRVT